MWVRIVRETASSDVGDSGGELRGDRKQKEAGLGGDLGLQEPGRTGLHCGTSLSWIVG